MGMLNIERITKKLEKEIGNAFNRSGLHDSEYEAFETGYLSAMQRANETSDEKGNV